MKKLNLLFLLIGVISLTMLSSCKPEENTDVDPSLAFISEASSITGNTTLAINTPYLIKISADQNPNTKKKLKTLRVQSFSNNASVIDTTYDINDDHFLVSLNYTTGDAYSTEEKFTLTITDASEKTAVKQVTITTEDAPAVSPDLSAGTDYSMARCGSSNDPVAYGIKYDQNTTATNARLISDGADKLVEFATAEWTNLVTQEDLATAVDAGTAITQFDLTISASGSNDKVVATKVGSTYTIMHFTGHTQTSCAGGSTETTLNAQFKQ